MIYNWKRKNFKQWCIDNKLDYNAVYYKFVSSYLSFENFMKKLEEKIKMQKDFVIEHKCKYFYNGKSLKAYCKENDLCYNTVIRRIYLYEGNIEKALEDVKKIRDVILEKEKNKKDNPCIKCSKRNCLGCLNYLFEEQDKLWKEDKNETHEKFD